ncbi:Smr/MutS family protein [bacterium]|nr:Smr/MutS family protein [bacterium]
MNDMDIFLNALNNMPEDIHSAKFNGSGTEDKHAYAHNGAFDITLDLTGMKKAEAVQTLENVLKKAHGKDRHILVLTGPVTVNEHDTDSIRDAVRYYCDREGSKYIRTFRAAPDEQGGEGTFILIT